MRASLDLAGILFKAFWKIKLMCPHSRKSEVLPSIYFWFRGTFSEQWGENQGHCRAKFPSQQVVPHPSAQGMDSGLFIPRKSRFCTFSDCCNLCPHHTEPKPAPEQQNPLLASPSCAFQWHQPAAAQHPWAAEALSEAFPNCCSSGQGLADTGITIQGSHSTAARIFGEMCPGNDRGSQWNRNNCIPNTSMKIQIHPNIQIFNFSQADSDHWRRVWINNELTLNSNLVSVFWTKSVI